MSLWRHKDSAQVQRLELVELGRRRCWITEAKLRIVEESFAGWRQASATARRHGISSSLLFAWRKAYRSRHDVEPIGRIDLGDGFPHRVRQIVDENCRALKFREHGFDRG